MTIGGYMCKYLVLFIFLTSCGLPECKLKSELNLCIYEEYNDGRDAGVEIEWTQEEFDVWEKVFIKHTGMNSLKLPYTVKDMRVTHWFSDFNQAFVIGETFCLGRQMWINNVSLNRSSITHEMFHVIQDCWSPLPVDKGADESHSNWIRDGIFDKIKAIQNEVAIEIKKQGASK